MASLTRLVKKTTCSTAGVHWQLATCNSDGLRECTRMRRRAPWQVFEYWMKAADIDIGSEFQLPPETRREGGEDGLAAGPLRILFAGAVCRIG